MYYVLELKRNEKLNDRMMNLSDIYIHALKKLDGFNKTNILKAIELANNDVVETLDDFIDFINFNIEDKRFENISQPFKKELIKNAVEKAIKHKDDIVHYVNPKDGSFPKKIDTKQFASLPLFMYKGNLENLKRKSILITGSPEVSDNAKLASEYIGKVLASNGYNILSSFSNECEENAIKGCKEAKGVSTFILPHNIENLTSEEIKIIQNELNAKRSMIISGFDYVSSNSESNEKSIKYTIALADCIIIPQISNADYIFDSIREYSKSDIPIYLLKYKTKNAIEYDCIRLLESLGVMYLTSNNVLKQIKDSIGEAIESDFE